MRTTSMVTVTSGSSQVEERGCERKKCNKTPGGLRLFRTSNGGTRGEAMNDGAF
jgi:hypothetical protein